MAETVLFNIANKIFETLTSLIIDGTISSYGAKDEFQRLGDNIGVIKGVLLDAEKNQHSSIAVKEWLETLKDVIYDADDLVDEIAAEVRMQELIMTENKMLKRVRGFFSSSNPLVVNVRLGNKVKDIGARLDVIKSNMATFNFVVRNVEEQVGNTGRKEETYSTVNTDDIIGREEDEKAITGMLLDSETQQNPSVIPIVGIGGLGKTALAQKVYNSEMIQKHFEVRLWVCISEDFDVKLIVRNIVKSIAYTNVDGIDFDELLRRIRGAVESKRYLLVLDDIWNENREKWLSLKRILPSGGVGSKIIVTTRSNIVADVMGTVPRYELKALSEERSWSLFERVAFKPGQIESCPELVDIGREIVKKCANVPLAIRTLGSLLYYKDTAREWLAITSFPSIEQDENHILPVLRISYDHLPSHLKNCFAFCALFPKDYTLSKEWLLNLWIGAGFIISSNRNQSLEDTAEDCFLLLLRRCFFQDVETDCSGSIVSCRMHDLLHDLAQHIAGKEIVHVVASDMRCLHGRTRYVNFSHVKSTWTLPPPLLVSKRLRMFSITGREYMNISASDCHTFFTRFKFLRMLDFHKAGLKEVPSSISQLKLLIFLDLSWNDHIKFLPKSFTKLLNLRILDLHNCQALQRLPRDFKKLVSLIHLDVRDCHSLTDVPPAVDELPPLLQGLSHVRFTQASIDTCKSWWRSNRCAMILTGVRSEDVQSLLPPLHVRLNDDVFVRSQQPTSLEVLEIKFYEGDCIPGWGAYKSPCPLSNIVVIKFVHCHSFQNLPLFSQLPALKVLVLQHMKALDYIENDIGGWSTSSSSAAAIFFPSLEELELSDLTNLKGWSREVASLVNHQQNHYLLPSFHLLSKLRISDCPNLTSIPLVSNVKNPHLNNVSEKLLQTIMKGRPQTTTSSTF